MAVVAVGDFDTELIEAKVKHHFAPPPRGRGLSGARSRRASPTDRPRYGVFPSKTRCKSSVFSDPESPGTQMSSWYARFRPETGQDLAALRRVVVERLAFMMLNARLFERGQVENPPYLRPASGTRGSFVQTLDIVQFEAWVEQDGVEPGSRLCLRRRSALASMALPTAELAREKVNLLTARWSVSTRSETSGSRSGLAREYTDHFLSGTPVPGIEAEWELYQDLSSADHVGGGRRSGGYLDRPGNTVLLVLRPEGM